MSRRRLLLLGGTFAVAAMTVVAVDEHAAQPLRIALGLSLAFALSGFSLTSVLVPGPELAVLERSVASLALSLALAATLGVLLAALPYGLSPGSFSVSLGGLTMAASLGGLLRALRRNPVTAS
jgi:uncharacterized membrane protein